MSYIIYHTGQARHKKILLNFEKFDWLSQIKTFEIFTNEKRIYENLKYLKVLVKKSGKTQVKF